MESTPGPPHLPERPEIPGANEREPHCPMAVSPRSSRAVKSRVSHCPPIRLGHPSDSAKPPRREPTFLSSRRVVRAVAIPAASPRPPSLGARLPPPEIPSSGALRILSAPIFFEGTFFCVASGRLPGDRRAIPPPASRRRRPPPIQAAAGRPPGTAGPSAPGS